MHSTRYVLFSITTMLCSGLIGCSNQSANSDCLDAADLVEECTGRILSCDDVTDGRPYQEIIATLEDDGCEALAGGKSDGFVCDLLSVFDWCSEPPPAMFGQPTVNATRFPIVLAHGFNTSTTNYWRFNDVDVALRTDGHTVILGSVPPFDTPQSRAAHLESQLDQILQESGAEKVNLICFSMGGLDCRVLASPNGLDRGDQIASITTISSPHRGTRIADALVSVLPSEANAGLIDALASLWGQTFSDLAEDSRVVAALESLAEANSSAFNQATPDSPNTIYESYAGFSHVLGFATKAQEAALDRDCRDSSGQRRIFRHEETRDPMDKLLWASTLFVGHLTEARPNDGVSTVISSKWGQFRGCVPADHLDLVGQINDGGPDKDTGFNFIGFYRFIASDLGARGL